MFKIRLLLILSLLSTCAFAQNKRFDSEYKHFITAKEEINTLRNSVLLIRLRNYKRSLDVFEKQGYTNAFNQLKTRIKTEHALVLHAARTLDFCPVYYYYDHDNDAVLAGDYSKLFNLDQTPANPSITNYYILNPYDETASSMNASIRGFFILNKQGELLHSPFPASVFSSIFVNDLSERLNKLNFQLLAYYNFHQSLHEYLKNESTEYFEMYINYQPNSLKAKRFMKFVKQYKSQKAPKQKRAQYVYEKK